MTDLPLVYLPQPIHEDGLAILEEGARVVRGYGEDGVPIAAVRDEVEGLLLRFRGIDAETVATAPRLRAISRAGAGYESIPLDAARERGIPVLVPSGVNARSVAEHVFALALAVVRNIPHWDRMARSGRDDLFELREGDLSLELSGKRLGLVGVGQIGGEVGRIGRDGFLMDLAAYHPRRTPEQLRASGYEPMESLHDLLAWSDVVSVHVPLSAETRGMFGAAEFAAMRPGSVFVNVSRGGVVDEAALAAAVATGRPGGAGVDVWADKVPRPDNPLLHVDRVVAIPHRAGRTEEAQRRAGVLAARALLDALAGREVVDAVDVAAR